MVKMISDHGEYDLIMVKMPPEKILLVCLRNEAFMPIYTVECCARQLLQYDNFHDVDYVNEIFIPISTICFVNFHW